MYLSKQVSVRFVFSMSVASFAALMREDRG